MAATKPAGLKTKIFLDSGDPAETKQLLSLLGFLDGQTTNPTLVAKNPYARARFEAGTKFSVAELNAFYKKVVSDISGLLPHGSVSVEVYADQVTAAEQMFAQGQDMYTWIPNAHIKYPTTFAGLEAAERSVQEGMRVNMTLCFSQEQAAAVYAATTGAHLGQVFVSPFVGRLDDIGENGMSLISNIKKMYTSGDSHVQVLAASIRTMDHFMQSLILGADIITAPYAILEEWGKAGMPLPDDSFSYHPDALKDTAYQEIDLSKSWSAYDIRHELTAKGVANFADNWNALIA